MPSKQDKDDPLTIFAMAIFLIFCTGTCMYIGCEQYNDPGVLQHGVTEQELREVERIEQIKRNIKELERR